MASSTSTHFKQRRNSENNTRETHPSSPSRQSSVTTGKRKSSIWFIDADDPTEAAKQFVATLFRKLSQEYRNGNFEVANVAAERLSREFSREILQKRLDSFEGALESPSKLKRKNSIKSPTTRSSSTELKATTSSSSSSRSKSRLPFFNELYQKISSKSCDDQDEFDWRVREVIRKHFDAVQEIGNQNGGGGSKAKSDDSIESGRNDIRLDSSEFSSDQIKSERKNDEVDDYEVFLNDLISKDTPPPSAGSSADANNNDSVSDIGIVVEKEVSKNKDKSDEGLTVFVDDVVAELTAALDDEEQQLNPSLNPLNNQPKNPPRNSLKSQPKNSLKNPQKNPPKNKVDQQSNHDNESQSNVYNDWVMQELPCAAHDVIYRKTNDSVTKIVGILSKDANNNVVTVEGNTMSVDEIAGKLLNDVSGIISDETNKLVIEVFRKLSEEMKVAKRASSTDAFKSSSIEDIVRQIALSSNNNVDDLVHEVFKKLQDQLKKQASDNSSNQSSTTSVEWFVRRISGTASSLNSTCRNSRNSSTKELINNNMQQDTLPPNDVIIEENEYHEYEEEDKMNQLRSSIYQNDVMTDGMGQSHDGVYLNDVIPDGKMGQSTSSMIATYNHHDKDTSRSSNESEKTLFGDDDRMFDFDNDTVTGTSDGSKISADELSESVCMSIADTLCNTPSTASLNVMGSRDVIGLMKDAFQKLSNERQFSINDFENTSSFKETIEKLATNADENGDSVNEALTNQVLEVISQSLHDGEDLTMNQAVSYISMAAQSVVSSGQIRDFIGNIFKQISQELCEALRQGKSSSLKSIVSKLIEKRKSTSTPNHDAAVINDVFKGLANSIQSLNDENISVVEFVRHVSHAAENVVSNSSSTASGSGEVKGIVEEVFAQCARRLSNAHENDNSISLVDIVKIVSEENCESTVGNDDDQVTEVFKKLRELSEIVSSNGESMSVEEVLQYVSCASLQVVRTADVESFIEKIFRRVSRELYGERSSFSLSSSSIKSLIESLSKQTSTGIEGFGEEEGGHVVEVFRQLCGSMESMQGSGRDISMKELVHHITIISNDVIDSSSDVSSLLQEVFQKLSEELRIASERGESYSLKDIVNKLSDHSSRSMIENQEGLKRNSPKLSKASSARNNNIKEITQENSFVAHNSISDSDLKNIVKTVYSRLSCEMDKANKEIGGQSPSLKYIAQELANEEYYSTKLSTKIVNEVFNEFSNRMDKDRKSISAVELVQQISATAHDVVRDEETRNLVDTVFQSVSQELCHSIEQGTDGSFKEIVRRLSEGSIHNDASNTQSSTVLAKFSKILDNSSTESISISEIVQHISVASHEVISFSSRRSFIDSIFRRISHEMYSSASDGSCKDPSLKDIITKLSIQSRHDTAVANDTEQEVFKQIYNSLNEIYPFENSLGISLAELAEHISAAANNFVHDGDSSYLVQEVFGRISGELNKINERGEGASQTLKSVVRRLSEQAQTEECGKASSDPLGEVYQKLSGSDICSISCKSVTITEVSEAISVAAEQDMISESSIDQIVDNVFQKISEEVQYPANEEDNGESSVTLKDIIDELTEEHVLESERKEEQTCEVFKKLSEIIEKSARSDSLTLGDMVAYTSLAAQNVVSKTSLRYSKHDLVKDLSQEILDDVDGVSKALNSRVSLPNTSRIASRINVKNEIFRRISSNLHDRDTSSISVVDVLKQISAAAVDVVCSPDVNTLLKNTFTKVSQELYEENTAGRSRSINDVVRKLSIENKKGGGSSDDVINEVFQRLSPSVDGKSNREHIAEIVQNISAAAISVVSNSDIRDFIDEIFRQISREWFGERQRGGNCSLQDIISNLSKVGGTKRLDNTEVVISRIFQKLSDTIGESRSESLSLEEIVQHISRAASSAHSKTDDMVSEIFKELSQEYLDEIRDGNSQSLAEGHSLVDIVSKLSIEKSNNIGDKNNDVTSKIFKKLSCTVNTSNENMSLEETVQHISTAALQVVSISDVKSFIEKIFRQLSRELCHASEQGSDLSLSNVIRTLSNQTCNFGCAKTKSESSVEEVFKRLSQDLSSVNNEMISIADIVQQISSAASAVISDVGVRGLIDEVFAKLSDELFSANKDCSRFSIREIISNLSEDLSSASRKDDSISEVFKLISESISKANYTPSISIKDIVKHITSASNSVISRRSSKEIQIVSNDGSRVLIEDFAEQLLESVNEEGLFQSHTKSLQGVKNKSKCSITDNVTRQESSSSFNSQQGVKSPLNCSVTANIPRKESSSSFNNEQGVQSTSNCSLTDNIPRQESSSSFNSIKGVKRTSNCSVTANIPRHDSSSSFNNEQGVQSTSNFSVTDNIHRHESSSSFNSIQGVKSTSNCSVTANIPRHDSSSSFNNEQGVQSTSNFSVTDNIHRHESSSLFNSIQGVKSTSNCSVTDNIPRKESSSSFNNEQGVQSTSNFSVTDNIPRHDSSSSFNNEQGVQSTSNFSVTDNIPRHESSSSFNSMQGVKSTSNCSVTANIPRKESSSSFNNEQGVQSTSNFSVTDNIPHQESSSSFNSIQGVQSTPNFSVTDNIHRHESSSSFSSIQGVKSTSNCSVTANIPRKESSSSFNSIQGVKSTSNCSVTDNISRKESSSSFNNEQGVQSTSNFSVTDNIHCHESSSSFNSIQGVKSTSNCSVTANIPGKESSSSFNSHAQSLQGVKSTSDCSIDDDTSRPASYSSFTGQTRQGDGGSIPEQNKSALGLDKETMPLSESSSYYSTFETSPPPIIENGENRRTSKVAYASIKQNNFSFQGVGERDADKNRNSGNLAGTISKASYSLDHCSNNEMIKSSAKEETYAGEAAESDVDNNKCSLKSSNNGNSTDTINIESSLQVHSNSTEQIDEGSTEDGTTVQTFTVREIFKRLSQHIHDLKQTGATESIQEFGKLMTRKESDLFSDKEDSSASTDGNNSKKSSIEMMVRSALSSKSKNNMSVEDIMKKFSHALNKEMLKKLFQEVSNDNEDLNNYKKISEDVKHVINEVITASRTILVKTSSLDEQQKSMEYIIHDEVYEANSSGSIETKSVDKMEAELEMKSSNDNEQSYEYIEHDDNAVNSKKISYEDVVNEASSGRMTAEFKTKSVKKMEELEKESSKNKEHSYEYLDNNDSVNSKEDFKKRSFNDTTKMDKRKEESLEYILNDDEIDHRSVENVTAYEEEEEVKLEDQYEYDYDSDIDSKSNYYILTYSQELLEHERKFAENDEEEDEHSVEYVVADGVAEGKESIEYVITDNSVNSKWSVEEASDKIMAELKTKSGDKMKGDLEIKSSKNKGISKEDRENLESMEYVVTNDVIDDLSKNVYKSTNNVLGGEKSTNSFSEDSPADESIRDRYNVSELTVYFENNSNELSDVSFEGKNGDAVNDSKYVVGENSLEENSKESLLSNTNDVEDKESRKWLTATLSSLGCIINVVECKVSKQWLLSRNTDVAAKSSRNSLEADVSKKSDEISRKWLASSSSNIESKSSVDSRIPYAETKVSDKWLSSYNSNIESKSSVDSRIPYAEIKVSDKWLSFNNSNIESKSSVDSRIPYAETKVSDKWLSFNNSNIESKSSVDSRIPYAETKVSDKWLSSNNTNGEAIKSMSLVTSRNNTEAKVSDKDIFRKNLESINSNAHTKDSNKWLASDSSNVEVKTSLNSLEDTSKNKVETKVSKKWLASSSSSSNTTSAKVSRSVLAGSSKSSVEAKAKVSGNDTASRSDMVNETVAEGMNNDRSKVETKVSKRWLASSSISSDSTSKVLRKSLAGSNSSSVKVNAKDSDNDITSRSEIINETNVDVTNDSNRSNIETKVSKRWLASSSNSSDTAAAKVPRSITNNKKNKRSSKCLVEGSSKFNIKIKTRESRKNATSNNGLTTDIEAKNDDKNTMEPTAITDDTDLSKNISEYIQNIKTPKNSLEEIWKIFSIKNNENITVPQNSIINLVCTLSRIYSQDNTIAEGFTDKLLKALRVLDDREASSVLKEVSTKLSKELLKSADIGDIVTDAEYEDCVELLAARLSLDDTLFNKDGGVDKKHTLRKFNSENIVGSKSGLSPHSFEDALGKVNSQSKVKAKPKTSLQGLIDELGGTSVQRKRGNSSKHFEDPPSTSFEMIDQDSSLPENASEYKTRENEKSSSIKKVEENKEGGDATIDNPSEILPTKKSSLMGKLLRKVSFKKTNKSSRAVKINKSKSESKTEHEEKENKSDSSDEFHDAEEDQSDTDSNEESTTPTAVLSETSTVEQNKVIHGNNQKRMQDMTSAMKNKLNALKDAVSKCTDKDSAIADIDGFIHDLSGICADISECAIGISAGMPLRYNDLVANFNMKLNDLFEVNRRRSRRSYSVPVNNMLQSTRNSSIGDKESVDLNIDELIAARLEINKLKQDNFELDEYIKQIEDRHHAEIVGMKAELSVAKLERKIERRRSILETKKSRLHFNQATSEPILNQTPKVKHKTKKSRSLSFKFWKRKPSTTTASEVGGGRMRTSHGLSSSSISNPISILPNQNGSSTVSKASGVNFVAMASDDVMEATSSRDNDALYSYNGEASTSSGICDIESHMTSESVHEKTRELEELKYQYDELIEIVALNKETEEKLKTEIESGKEELEKAKAEEEANGYRVEEIDYVLREELKVLEDLQEDIFENRRCVHLQTSMVNELRIINNTNLKNMSVMDNHLNSLVDFMISFISDNHPSGNEIELVLVDVMELNGLDEVMKLFEESIQFVYRNESAYKIFSDHCMQTDEIGNPIEEILANSGIVTTEKIFLDHCMQTDPIEEILSYNRGNVRNLVATEEAKKDFAVQVESVNRALDDGISSRQFDDVIASSDDEMGKKRSRDKRRKKSLRKLSTEQSRNIKSKETITECKPDAISTRSKGIITGRKDTIARRRNTIAGNKETIVGSKNTITGSKDTISGRRNTIAGSKNTISESKNTIDGSKNSISERKNTIDGSKNTIARRRNTISNSKNAIAGSKDTISNSKNTIAGSKDTIAGSKGTIVGDKDTDRFLSLENSSGSSITSEMRYAYNALNEYDLSNLVKCSDVQASEYMENGPEYDTMAKNLSACFKNNVVAKSSGSDLVYDGESEMSDHKLATRSASKVKSKTRKISSNKVFENNDSTTGSSTSNESILKATASEQQDLDYRKDETSSRDTIRLIDSQVELAKTPSEIKDLDYRKDKTASWDTIRSNYARAEQKKMADPAFNADTDSVNEDLVATPSEIRDIQYSKKKDASNEKLKETPEARKRSTKSDSKRSTRTSTFSSEVKLNETPEARRMSAKSDSMRSTSTSTISSETRNAVNRINENIRHDDRSKKNDIMQLYAQQEAEQKSTDTSHNSSHSSQSIKCHKEEDENDEDSVLERSIVSSLEAIDLEKKSIETDIGYDSTHAYNKEYLSRDISADTMVTIQQQTDQNGSEVVGRDEKSRGKALWVGENSTPSEDLSFWLRSAEPKGGAPQSKPHHNHNMKKHKKSPRRRTMCDKYLREGYNDGERNSNAFTQTDPDDGDGANDVTMNIFSQSSETSMMSFNEISTQTDGGTEFRTTQDDEEGEEAMHFNSSAAGYKNSLSHKKSPKYKERAYYNRKRSGGGLPTKEKHHHHHRAPDRTPRTPRNSSMGDKNQAKTDFEVRSEENVQVKINVSCRASPKRKTRESPRKSELGRREVGSCAPRRNNRAEFEESLGGSSEENFFGNRFLENGDHHSTLRDPEGHEAYYSDYYLKYMEDLWSAKIRRGGMNETTRSTGMNETTRSTGMSDRTRRAGMNEYGFMDTSRRRTPSPPLCSPYGTNQRFCTDYNNVMLLIKDFYRSHNNVYN